jgi:hypothetical protein
MIDAAISTAERHAEVRAAARTWRESGIVDDRVVAAVDERYPDDRVRLPMGLRILAFVLATLAVSAAFGFVLLAGNGDGEITLGLVAACFSAACGWATEVQRGAWRRAQAGAELATAVLTVAFLVGAAMALADGLHAPASPAIGFAAVIAGLLAMRWGSATLGVVAALLCLFFLAQFPASRLLWMVFATATLAPLARASRAPALAPSQRRAGLAAGIVVLVGATVALNLVSLDERWVEDWRLEHPDLPGTWMPRIACAIATALLPIALIGAGLRWRSGIAIVMGIAAAVAAVLTLRYYHALLPLPYALLAGGALLLVASLALRRWLHAGPNCERGGWTAEPLFAADDGTTGLGAVAAAFAMRHPAAPTTESAPDLRGEGRFGGGGASGRY